MNNEFKFDQYSHDQLVEIAQLAVDQAKVYDDNKLDFYVPHAGQLEFHKSNHLIRAAVTGNRFGKTTASVVEAIQLALGVHPYHPIKIPNKGKMYAESFNHIDEVLRVKFEEWLPTCFLAKRRPWVYNQLGNLTGINFANGSIIRFGSYDQREKKSEGSDWDYVAFDEPPPRPLYIANLRGLIDRGGKMWFTLTPLSEAWIFDEIWEPGITGEKKYIKCISGSSYDNPYTNKESLKIFEAELTEEEKLIRIKGQFLKLKGLVIDTFDKQASLIDPFILDHNFMIYEGIDPHPAKPNAALWKAIDKFNRRFVVAELSCADGIYEFGKQIVAKRRELTVHGARLVKSIADTSLNQKDLMFKVNQRDELCKSLREEGEIIFPSNAQKKDWLAPGIAKIRDLFRVVKHNFGGLQVMAPQQQVFKSCPNYIWELGHYQWPKHDHIRDLKDEAKPIGKYNDFIDCDRYIESIAPDYATPGMAAIIHQPVAYQRIATADRFQYAQRAVDSPSRTAGDGIVRYPVRTFRGHKIRGTR